MAEVKSQEAGNVASFIEESSNESESENNGEYVFEEEEENENENNESSSDIDLMNIGNKRMKNENESENEDENGGEKSGNTIMRAEDVMAKMMARTQEELSKFPSVLVENDVSLSYDLGNMTVFDACDINQRLMPNNENKDLQIRKENEKYLIEMSRNNTQAMVNQLFKLPVRTDAENEGMSLVKLPPARTKLPREKPLPMIKEKTRWEKFAERKNIRKNKRNPHLNKKLEWDEDRKEWRKKWGFNKANNEMENPIFEHKDGDMSKEDPWTAMKKEKQKRIAINQENRKLNLINSTKLHLNSNDTVNLQDAIKHSKLKPKNKLSQQKELIKGKREERKEKKFNFSKYGNLSKELKIAQHSTASMGKFDKLSKYEPKPSLKANINKRKDDNNTNTSVNEQSKQKEILFNIFGKESKSAFNVNKASKSAKIQMEIKRSRKRKRR